VKTKPVASLSLDLDNLWSYLKVRGDADWEALPSYLDVVVPRVLQFLDDLGLTITIFIVGQDAALPQHADLLRGITAAGHEVGNHSFSHEPWMHRYDDAQVLREVADAEDAIASVTGERPTGFRGPGYSLSPSTLQVLLERGYRYDASTLPTFVGPLARAFYFRTSGLTKEQRRQREALFGAYRDGLRPVKPYTWALGDERLVELPVTTMPFARVPIHLSYVLHLHGISPALARRYFDAALRLCRWTGVGPSILLHPLDFVDRRDADALAFFPGMELPAEAKLDVVGESLRLLADRFDVGPTGRHVDALAAASLPTLRPGRLRPVRAPRGGTAPAAPAASGAGARHPG
jgi:hypothetical protein